MEMYKESACCNGYSFLVTTKLSYRQNPITPLAARAPIGEAPTTPPAAQAPLLGKEGKVSLPSFSRRGGAKRRGGYSRAA